jgi:hypothetical protein
MCRPNSRELTLYLDIEVRMLTKGQQLPPFEGPPLIALLHMVNSPATSWRATLASEASCHLTALELVSSACVKCAYGLGSARERGTGSAVTQPYGVGFRAPRTELVSA